MTALRRVRLGEGVAILIVLFLKGTVERLFKNRLGVNNLKLGPKVLDMVRDSATVGAATGIGESKVLIGNFLMEGAPECVLVMIRYTVFDQRHCIPTTNAGDDVN